MCVCVCVCVCIYTHTIHLYGVPQNYLPYLLRK